MIERDDRNRSDSAEQAVISRKYSGAERRGKERRGKERRGQSDRRGEYRTDGKLSRRTGKGRRKGEKIGLFLRDVAKK